MKQILHILLAVFIFINTSLLSARTRIPSDIALPSNHIASLEYFDDTYGIYYLKKLLKDGKIFSFIELYKHFDIAVDYKTDKELYNYIKMFRIPNGDDTTLNIAIIIPSKEIGGYLKSISTSVLNYMIFNQRYFKMKVYDFVTQNSQNLQKSINKAQAQGYSSVILIITDKGLDDLKNIHIPFNMNIFIPTINISDTDADSYFPSNVFFGGISYKHQIDKLTQEINPKQSVVYSDKGEIGLNLSRYIQEKDLNVTALKTISNKRTYYKNIIDIPQIDENATIFLNTPLVISSIILSNLTYNKKEFRRILSTQINYNPSIFNLTQTQDIEKLYIANSILDRHQKIEDINLLMNNDIIYNWVNYTTVLGANFLINKSGYFTSYYNIPISNNQFIYDIQIVKPTKNKFVPSIIEQDPIYESNETNSSQETISEN